MQDINGGKIASFIFSTFFTTYGAIAFMSAIAGFSAQFDFCLWWSSTYFFGWSITVLIVTLIGLAMEFNYYAKKAWSSTKR